MIILGLMNEVVVFVFFSSKGSAMPTNIYYLIESILLPWQFRNWGNILKKKRTLITIISVFIVLWIIDYFIIGSIYQYRLIFQLVSAFTLVLLAINQLNWLIENDRRTLTKNPIFLICVGIIAFFCYKIMAEVFFTYAPEITLKRNIFVIESYLNVIYNILLYIAILCIAPKKVFTQPSL